MEYLIAVLFIAFLIPLILSVSVCSDDRPVVLIVDGQNTFEGHRWAEIAPVTRAILEETGLFDLRVVSTPPLGGDMSLFKLDFGDVDAVILNNYVGDAWPEETNEAFEAFVRSGGGFVVMHSANNAFSSWQAFNEMIGVGGWGGRDAGSGPFIRWRDGRQVIEQLPGESGHHGAQHEFVVTTRAPDHPIMKGLPDNWKHSRDELYDSLRGPARNVTILATAFSDPEFEGTGEHEPMLMAINYGRGRVFHMVLGHDVEAMQSVGYIVTFQRGVEWAATGEVTQPVPTNLPL